jgi:probable rRNA maturation factor
MADDDQPPLILVDDRQSIPLDVDELATVARECLVGEGAVNSELSVSFVTDEEMSDLHRRYMDEEGPTDVLSFPQDDDDGGGPTLLGDVVIAPSVAERNNPGDPAGEMKLLLVHGILHLLGHDHDDEGERAAMWARQERYARVER